MNKAVWNITLTLATTIAIGGCSDGSGKHGTVTAISSWSVVRRQA